MQPQFNVHQALQRKAAASLQVADSQPRSSRVRFTVKVDGVGETRLEGAKGIDFGTLMIDEPTFSFGVIATGPMAAGSLPQATAIVLNWQRNSQGLYIGADMGFVVNAYQSSVSLRYSLTFEGSAFRASTGHDGALGNPSPTGQNTYRGAL